MKNIILIGMPGCGKSTAGVILAKTLGVAFADTDLMIQVRRESTLQRLIDVYGAEKFEEFEDAALLAAADMENAVIATGGSAVFCPNGMRALKRGGVCVYIKLPLEELESRLSNIKTRGISCRKGETLAEIMSEREPLYEKYADVVIEAAGKTVEEVVEETVEKLTIDNG